MTLYALWVQPTLFHIQRTYPHQTVITARVLEARWSQCALIWWGLLCTSCCLPLLQRTFSSSQMIVSKQGRNLDRFTAICHISRSHYDKKLIFCEWGWRRWKVLQHKCSVEALQNGMLQFSSLTFSHWCELAENGRKSFKSFAASGIYA